MKKSILNLIVLTFICVTAHSQVDTISENIYQKDGKLGIGISDPISNISVLSTDTIETYEKLLELKINGISDSYIQFRNNTNLYNNFEPCIHASTNFSERSALMIMGNILKDGDINDNAIINITPYVDNGLGWQNGGYDYPEIRHYFRIRGYKSGVGDKPLFEIDQDGNVGISTKTPYTKLEIKDGDIYISDIEKGIIMKSPDGQCWRGTVDNFGSLNFTLITCPENVSVAIEETKISTQILLSPNPTKNNVKLRIEELEFKKLKYFVFDVNGKILDQGRIKNNEQIIELASFISGIYLIKIIDKKGNIISTTKVIKK
jgi:hypothetical protein